MKILFFGTSEFAVSPLMSLINSHFDVVGVVTTPDRAGKRGKKLIEPPVKSLAKQYSIEIYQPESLKSEDAYEKIKGFDADIFVVVSYGKFLTLDILKLSKYEPINIHPSLLPKYRGPSPINYALLNGDRYTGVSIIGVTDKMDAGDIYMQWIEKIYEKDNYETLHSRLSLIGAEMVMCTLCGIFEKRIKPRKQDESKATFTKIIEKQDGLIDFNSMSAREIVNKVKAYYIWPTAYFSHKNKIFKILEADMLNDEAAASKVLRVSKHELVIGCAEGSVSIKAIQPESKKPMKIKAFLAGYKFESGEIIG